MKYHARLIYGANQSQYYTDWSKDLIIKELLFPFINGHVVYLKSRKTILNLKNVSELTLYKTEKTLKEMGIKNKESELRKYECTKELIDETRVVNAAENSTSLLQKSLAKEKNQVFVVMKFGDKILDSAYEGVTKPLFEEFKMTVMRVDEIEDSGKISDQILQNIAESKFILSELTDERPNCYYETGFAHALGKEIILCIHKKSKVHFDLAGHRFIQWETESELRRKLKERIKKLMEKK